MSSQVGIPVSQVSPVLSLCRLQKRESYVPASQTRRDVTDAAPSSAGKIEVGNRLEA